MTVNPSRNISLTTDFGMADPYAGIMKAVLAGLAPEARVIDLTHSVPPGDVVAGMLALEAAYGYFPAGSVHVAVVDPGVGTDREIVAARAFGMIFLAPDNGILSFIPEERMESVNAVRNREFFREPVSPTFHGRDIFAPVAARLSQGLDPSRLGPAMESIRRLAGLEPEATGTGVKGKILAFDHFGNALTSIKAGHIISVPKYASAGGGLVRFLGTFGEAAIGEPLAYMGSGGRLEIAVNRGNAEKDLNLARGAPVELFW